MYASTNDFVSSVAQHCRLSEPAQQAVLRIPGVRRNLCVNEYVDLHPTVWTAAYGTKQLAAADDAVALINRPLTNELVEHVIEVETRVRPLNELIVRHRLTQKQMETLIGKKKCGQAAAAALVEAGVAADVAFAAEFRRRLVNVAGGDALLCWLAFDNEAVEADALAAFSTYVAPKGVPTRAHRRRLNAVVDRFPAVLSVCVAAGSAPSLLSAACSSRYLTDERLQHAAVSNPESHGDILSVGFAWIALANLPVTHKSTLDQLAGQTCSLKAAEAAATRLRRYDVRPTVTVPYADVEDQAVLSWLVGRVCSFTSRRDNTYTPPKPFELIALAANPNLQYEDSKRIAADLKSWEVSEAAGEAAHVAYMELSATCEPALIADPASCAQGKSQVYSTAGARERTVPVAIQLEAAENAALQTTASGLHRLAYRSSAHQYIESLALTEAQWSVLFDLAPTLPDMTVRDCVEVVGSL